MLNKGATVAGRHKSYTARGIKRLPCSVKGCTNKAHAEWRICADGNLARPICRKHDVAINETIMRYVFGNDREMDLARYRQKVLAA